MTRLLDVLLLVTTFACVVAAIVVPDWTLFAAAACALISREILRGGTLTR